MAATEKIKKTKLIEQITKAYGNLAAVARAMNLSRNTIYVFLEKKGNEDVKDHLASIREAMIDNVESALYSKALGGDTVSMIFFLKTQGYKRGYVERHEMEHRGSVDLGIAQVREVVVELTGPDLKADVPKVTKIKK